MKNIMGLCAGVAMLSGVCGCNELSEEVQSLQRKNDEQSATIARVTQEVEQLQQKVADFERRQDSMLAQAAENVITQRFGSTIQSAVSQQVAEQLKNQTGFDEALKSRIQAEIAANDAKIEAQKAAAEQARQEERDRRRQERTDQRWAAAAKELSLNETQVTALRGAEENIRTTLHDTMDEMRQSGEWNPGAMREKAQSIRTEYEAELAKILTPEQLESFKKNPGSMFGGMEFMGRGGRTPPTGQPPQE